MYVEGLIVATIQNTPRGYLIYKIYPHRVFVKRYFKTGHFLSRHSHIMSVIRRSMSMRAVLHSPGYFFAALNASVTKSAEPMGSMVLSIPSGKTKCVPCSYMTASTSQVCGCTASVSPCGGCILQCPIEHHPLHRQGTACHGYSRPL